MPIPTVEQWTLTVSKAAGETPVNALADAEWIAFVTGLLQAYHGTATEKKKGLAAIYLFYAAARWRKKGGTNYKSGPQTGALRMGMTGALKEAVDDLYLASRSHIRDALLMDDGEDESDAEMLKVLADTCGATNRLRTEDLKQVQELKLAYLNDDAARTNYKIRFRGGVAYRVSNLLAGEEREWTPYDSKNSGEAEHPDTQPGLVHYAMDYRGRLYVGFRKDVTFYHSSFVKGENVLAAGTMRIEEGRIREINLESGHYKPEPRHLAHALAQLRLHGVELGQVLAKPFGGKGEPAPQFLAKELGQYSGTSSSSISSSTTTGK